MFLNAFTDRSRPNGQKRRCKQQLAFDFVVAERPMYVPGSGPPLAPISVMPAHDKDGVIQGEVKMDNQLRYIVGYETHPYLRVSVKPQNILDWVSPRTLEDWEFEKTKAEYQADEDELLPKILAREQRKKLKEQEGNVSRASDGPKKTWSRKRKRPPTPEPPLFSGRKRKYVDTEDEEAPGISLRRPSLSTPVKQRGLAEVLNFDDSEEDEDSFVEDTTELLHRQLIGAPTARSKLRMEHARSPTTSPDPQPLKSKKTTVFDWRKTKSGSISSTAGDGRGRETRSSSTSRPPSRRDSVAAISSRQARAIYEKLEVMSQSKAGSLTENYAYSGNPPTSSQRQAAANASARHRSETPKRKEIALSKPVEEDDTEYEVDAILADAYRKNENGKLGLWYLIKWVGDWENTWEPAENVGVEAIAEYQAKKTAEETRTENLDMASGTADSYNEDITGMDLKGKGNQQKLKVGIDDAASSSSEELEFRAKAKRRIPFGSGGRDVEVGEKGKMKVPFGNRAIDLTVDSSEEESDSDSHFVKEKTPEKLGLKKAPPSTMSGQVNDDASVSDGS